MKKLFLILFWGFPILIFGQTKSKSKEIDVPKTYKDVKATISADCWIWKAVVKKTGDTVLVKIATTTTPAIDTVSRKVYDPVELRLIELMREKVNQ
jgi:hypothetical protein